MPALIAIEITVQEADAFRKLRESGVFEIRNGNATLHFNAAGFLAKIDKHLVIPFSRVENLLDTEK